MNAVLFITKIIFLKQCYDKVDDYSVSGLISRVLTLAIMFLWRIITVTMCVFIMRQAQQIHNQDYVTICKDIHYAICEEDDELYVDEDGESVDQRQFLTDQESDQSNDDDSHLTESEQEEFDVRRNESKFNALVNRQEEDFRKKSLFLVLMSISKGKYMPA